MVANYWLRGCWVVLGIAMLCALLVMAYPRLAMRVPDTFADMELRLDSLPLPADWRLVEASHGGSRLWGPRPYVSRSFAADWSDQLCGSLVALGRALGDAQALASHPDCGFTVRIRAGWKARVVTVWSYELRAYAVSPTALSRPSEAECASIRLRHASSRIAEVFPFRRTGVCWVALDEAMVMVRLRS